ncbi:hypothetical protein EAH72_12300 [Pseudomonas caspiana]|uniref:Uncharacterized protein n=1 Tax=Pseudomonas mandelii TaxID=75612 RepID=A0A502I910_9PSED|nr:hypothetical protein EAH74_16195 [Pseudomonas mandelii]TPG96260.1 hypothetical protein EAH72_12300 [Pseudomonas caspiana]
MSVRPLSRAGSLPQGAAFQCGSEPAREAVDTVSDRNIERDSATTVCSLYRRIHRSKETLTCHKH